MIDVSCAIITDLNGGVLVTQRSEVMHLPMKWEFPGGKVEPGESAAECLIREIREELGIIIELGKEMTAVVFDDGKQVIRLIPFQAMITKGEIKLAEHAAFLWLQTVQELEALDWAEADVTVLREYLNGRGS